MIHHIFFIVGFILVNRQEGGEIYVCVVAFKCEEVKGEGSVQSKAVLAAGRCHQGSTVHTFYFHRSVHHGVTLLNTARHLCILHVSNLEAVIDQFGQDECPSKCP